MGAANPYHGSISFLQVLSSGLTEVLKIFDLRTICCLEFRGGKRRGGWEFGLVGVQLRDSVLISHFSLSPWDLLTVSRIPLWGLDVLQSKLHPNPFSSLRDHGFLHLFLIYFPELCWNWLKSLLVGDCPFLLSTLYRVPFLYFCAFSSGGIWEEPQADSFIRSTSLEVLHSWLFHTLNCNAAQQVCHFISQTETPRKVTVIK